MTWIAQLKATEVRQLLGTDDPISADRLCEELEIPLHTYRFDTDIRGAYLDGEIGVDPRLSWEERELIIIHEVGHHVIHGPEADMRFWARRNRMIVSKMERQAHDFAYLFALPTSPLVQCVREGGSVYDLATAYNRSRRWVYSRVLLGWDAGEFDALREEWVA